MLSVQDIYSWIAGSLSVNPNIALVVKLFIWFILVVVAYKFTSLAFGRRRF